MNETLNEKAAHWARRRSEVQARKNKQQYTKTSTQNEKLQKQKTLEHYDNELKKIREITDAIEHLRGLEREF